MAIMLIVPACGTYYEMKSKEEYSALQGVEYNRRDQPIKDFEILEHRGFRLAGFRIQRDGTNVWVLLNSRHPPFYKQMPDGKTFTVSKEALDAVRSTPDVNQDVLSTLESRVARQDD